MSAFGRGKRRRLLLARALGAAAAALAASLAWAGAPAAEPNRGGGIRLLSPEAPASFGAMGDVSPLIAAFNAARAPQDDALRLMLFAEPASRPSRRSRPATQPLCQKVPPPP